MEIDFKSQREMHESRFRPCYIQLNPERQMTRRDFIGALELSSYPSSASTSAARNDSFSQLRRKIRFKRSRYSRDRSLKASVEGSASSAVKESPLVTRNVARNI